MKLRAICVVCLGLQICQLAVAGSLFRCEVNGRVEYSDRRCQPAKPICSERDGKELQHGQCAPPSDTSKPPALFPVPVVQVRTGNGVDWPGRLALNEIASSIEGRQRTVDVRSGSISSQNVDGRSASEGKR